MLECEIAETCLPPVALPKAHQSNYYSLLLIRVLTEEPPSAAARTCAARRAGRSARAARGGAAAAGHLAGAKDWIELFIRNEKILSPDSEISRNFHFFKVFFAIFCNYQQILLFSHTPVKFRENFIKI